MPDTFHEINIVDFGLIERSEQVRMMRNLHEIRSRTVSLIKYEVFQSVSGCRWVEHITWSEGTELRGIRVGSSIAKALMIRLRDELELFCFDPG